MTTYHYINHVLANYFASSIGFSEQEATELLVKDVDLNEKLAQGLKFEVREAMADESFSWSKALSDYDVIPGMSEADARKYATKIFEVVKY